MTPRPIAKLIDHALPGSDASDGLRRAMSMGCVVDLGPYDWDFYGQLINGECDDFAACRITGPADEYGCQHLEEGRKTNRFASRINVHGLEPGQPWVDWKPSENDRGGPMGISNTVLQVNGAGRAMRLGNANNPDPHGVDARKLDLSGLYVTLPDQLATNDFDGVELPSYARFPVIEIIRGYDVTINRVGVRGGGTQLRLLQCDRPSVRHWRAMHCVRSIAVDSLPGNAATKASISDVMVENFIGTAIDAESANVSDVTTEAGYDAKVGRFRIEADWRIDAGESRVDVLGMTGKLFAGQLVYVGGDWLRVKALDDEGFEFDGGDSHCFYARSAKGDSFEACYGVGVIGRGDRFDLDHWSSDHNRDLPNLPVAAFVPRQSTMPVGRYGNSRGPWMGADNRSVIVGHCCGRQWDVEGSVDFAGTSMRPNHPLCHPGVGPVTDPGWNRWLGIWSGNDEGRCLKFRELDGKSVVRLDDSKTGRRMAPARSYTFRVYAHEPSTLSVYGGRGRPNAHELVNGWQNVSGIFPFESTMMILGSAPVSVELPR